ncbi:hypothetical protein L6R21_27680 [bacterium]|nr:hypothetical protein [bacterium]
MDFRPEFVAERQTQRVGINRHTAAVNAGNENVNAFFQNGLHGKLFGLILKLKGQSFAIHHKPAGRSHHGIDLAGDQLCL